MMKKEDKGHQIPFNKKQEAYIRRENEKTTRIYFDSLHDHIKDLPKNVSEEVIKDVHKIIDPAVESFVSENGRVHKRIDRIVFIGGLFVLIFATAILLLSYSKEAKAKAHKNADIEIAIQNKA